MAKEPWLAVFLSALLPGAGQLYGSDRRTKGIAFIALWFLLVLIFGTSFIVFLICNNLTLSRVSLLVLVLIFLIIPLFYIYILFDAHKTAAKHNVLHHINIQLATEKKSWLAVFLTYIFPGLGQFYNKQLFKGIAFILIAVIFMFAVELYPFVHFFYIPLSLFFIKDAFDSAERINNSDKIFFKQGNRKGKIFVVIMIGVHGLPIEKFSEIIKHNFVQSYKTPSSGMYPALEIGDHFLVDKTIMGNASSVKRGDIIIFKYPEDNNKDFIKRVIAIGGDKIQIKDKKIFIDDKPFDDRYGFFSDQKILSGGRSIVHRDNYGPVTVPDKNLFVLGDNRDKSYDSRYWGCVPEQNIKGKAIKIYWSWEKPFYNIRWNRIGKKI